jgi:hypothetical protein
MLRQRLDREDGNLPDVTDVLDESSKLAEREFGHQRHCHIVHLSLRLFIVLLFLLLCTHWRWLLQRFTIAKRSISARSYFKEIVSAVILIVFSGGIEKTRKSGFTSKYFALLAK